jgi:hypothetical protein
MSQGLRGLEGSIANAGAEAMSNGARIHKAYAQFRDRYSGAVDYPNKSLPATYIRNAEDIDQMDFKTRVVRKMGEELGKGTDGVMVNYSPQESDFKLYKDQEKADFAYQFDVFMLNKLKNTTDPGKRKYLESIYPELIKRKEDQIAQDITEEVDQFPGPPGVAGREHPPNSLNHPPRARARQDGHSVHAQQDSAQEERPHPLPPLHGAVRHVQHRREDLALHRLFPCCAGLF